jgi:hypothetical protein
MLSEKTKKTHAPFLLLYSSTCFLPPGVCRLPPPTIHPARNTAAADKAGVLKFNPVLTLFTWKETQISQEEGSMLRMTTSDASHKAGLQEFLTDQL